MEATEFQLCSKPGRVQITKYNRQTMRVSICWKLLAREFDYGEFSVEILASIDTLLVVNCLYIASTYELKRDWHFPDPGRNWIIHCQALDFSDKIQV